MQQTDSHLPSCLPVSLLLQLSCQLHDRPMQSVGPSLWAAEASTAAGVPRLLAVISFDKYYIYCFSSCSAGSIVSGKRCIVFPVRQCVGTTSHLLRMHVNSGTFRDCFPTCPPPLKLGMSHAGQARRQTTARSTCRQIATGEVFRWLTCVPLCLPSCDPERNLGHCPS